VARPPAAEHDQPDLHAGVRQEALRRALHPGGGARALADQRCGRLRRPGHARPDRAAHREHRGEPVPSDRAQHPDHDDDWNGLTSGGVTVSRVSEGTEAGDNSPTLAQPTVTPQRVQGFIPFSIEVGQDWTGLQAEMARELAEAKDVEEATSYTTGTGTPPAAQGVITGATTTVTAGGTAAFAGADLYKVEEALPDRFLPNAQWLGTRFAYNKIRQFDTAGGASIWTKSLTENIGTDASGNTGYELLGYPANRVSTMTAALTTGSKILVLGDFSRFAIVDRIGMDIELIPHLFGAANRRPTGQRGIYAIWRNDSRVLDANAFRVLITG
jgi:HK97 family phage major capsid protein